MFVKRSSTWRGLALPIAGILGLGSVSAVIYHDLSAWTAVSVRQSEMTRVGTLGENECCSRAAYTDCAPQCVVNAGCPSQPPNNTTYGWCGLASCQAAPAGNVCTTPSTTANYTGHKCQTTGTVLTCTDPTKQVCQAVLTPQVISFKSCNPGESLCATQPNPACQ